jgi:hypothetical protein
MKKYQHLIFPNPVSTENTTAMHKNTIDAYGAEGWELVAVVGPSAIDGYDSALTYFFRRPLEQEG